MCIVTNTLPYKVIKIHLKQLRSKFSIHMYEKIVSLWNTQLGVKKPINCCPLLLLFTEIASQMSSYITVFCYLCTVQVQRARPGRKDLLFSQSDNNNSSTVARNTASTVRVTRYRNSLDQDWPAPVTLPQTREQHLDSNHGPVLYKLISEH